MGNRAALAWVIDQYQVSQEKRSGIMSDPNNPDDEEYIVRLVGKVITVSMETVRLVNELAQAVTREDWMNWPPVSAFEIDLDFLETFRRQGKQAGWSS